MGWYITTLALVLTAGILVGLATFGDPERTRDRWLAAIFFELSAIVDLLWLISRQGG